MCVLQLADQAVAHHQLGDKTAPLLPPQQPRPAAASVIEPVQVDGHNASYVVNDA
jgi:hypothetical protein